MLEYVIKIKETFHYDISELNLGGGFAATYTDEERKPYSYYLDPAMEKIDSFFAVNGVKRPAVVIEPGRSVVAEAGLSLYTIGSIKEIKGIRKYLSVDGGMTDNLRPALYNAVYSGVVANRASEPKTEVVTIAGKCCESGDILIKDIKVAENVEPGDLFAVFTTGAYGYSMASNYNRNPVPPVVLVKEGRSELIVKRQSFMHMISNDMVPEHLK
jgi:diaminopimelate decarboxylase